MNIDAGEYSIYLKDTMQELQQFLSQHYGNAQKFILVDENTEAHCLPHIDWSDVVALKDAEVLLIEPGESQKNIEIVHQLWCSLLECGADRSAVLVNLGGGVIGDMGGFTAATFKRGIDFVQVPTTLLSMVDASVGGKLGIDLLDQKNMVGLFAHPKAVFIDPTFLQTLDDRNKMSGWAEMLKHGLIADSEYWSHLIELHPLGDLNWEELIAYSVKIKHQVVTDDFKEAGVRKILNFGHTIGHAIETFLLSTDHPLLHGEAIVAGMIAELYLSYKTFSEFETPALEVAQKLSGLYSLPILPAEIFDALIQLMVNDKKNSSGAIEFVLLKEVGEATWGHVAAKEEIADALSCYNRMVSEYGK